jgi:hypothetical protein
MSGELSVRESIALMKKFDDLKKEILVNYAVDQQRRELNPKVLDSLDKIDNIKM